MTGAIFDFGDKWLRTKQMVDKSRLPIRRLPHVYRALYKWVYQAMNNYGRASRYDFWIRC